MLELAQQLEAARGAHNAHVLALRQRKRQLLPQLNNLRGRLAVVEALLGAASATVGKSTPEAGCTSCVHPHLLLHE